MKTRAKLDVEQFLQIGKVALSEKEYTLALPWFELTIQKIMNKEIRYPIRNTTLKNAQRLLWETVHQVSKGFHV